MNSANTQAEELKWKCHLCQEPLKLSQVTVEYMGNQFTTDLPKCPRCGLILISEELALGKMAEVEQILEDK